MYIIWKITFFLGNHHLHDRSFQDSAEYHSLIAKVFPRSVETDEEIEEDYPNYPSAEIRKFLEKNPILRDYFVSVPVIPQIGKILCAGCPRFHHKS